MNWGNVGPTIWPWPLICLWPWPWIFKVKFSICCISGRGLLGMKCKGYELIQCWTHNMTLTFDPTHDFDLGFFKVKSRNSCISGLDGSCLDHLHRCIRKWIKAANGNMGKNKWCVWVWGIPDYCVVSLIYRRVSNIRRTKSQNLNASQKGR